MDPLQAFAPFANDPVAALLHSDGQGSTGRWSYLAVSPFRTLDTDSHAITRCDGQVCDGSPFAVVADHLKYFQVQFPDAPAPFIGGAVGFLSYEMAGFVEALPRAKTGADGPLMTLGFYDVIAAFDHQKKKAWVIGSGLPEQTDSERQDRATKRVTWLAEKIRNAAERPLERIQGSWVAEQTRDEVEHAILKTIGLIRAGDIFQANITQRFTSRLKDGAAAWNVFRTLRQQVPSPFGAYISASAAFKLLSASPERFLRVDPLGTVETRPIKGSRPRGATPAEDQALAQDLMASPKDQAENLMITDLMRNDLARVCQAGSVSVDALCALETFPAIHHLVSVVSGRLRSDQTAVDLLHACFPGGSVTGAPKVRAMEIIHGLEPAARGPYCGAVVWIGFNGAMDSSIVIRSLVADGNTLIAQAGGGIVAESDPAAEYAEAMVKVQPLLNVLQQDP